MIGIALDFTTYTKPTFITYDKIVNAFDTTVQNALVMLATTRGTCKAYPDMGTTLLLEGARGNLITRADSDVAGAFASNSVVTFSQLHDLPTNSERLQILLLKSTSMVNQTLYLSAQAVSSSGTTRGTFANL